MQSKILFTAVVLASNLIGQTLEPAKLMQPPTDTWSMYNGDYSGRRFSTLKKINDANINSLSFASGVSGQRRKRGLRRVYQSNASLDTGRSLLHDAGPCLGNRRAHGT